eukprot:TRINITY_DN1607_c0_g3_i1.p2 TRINITY_DN1607_c0_g3~~TRINITY_DN1607_c0_g3_i1.p2  ORF type:complete len:665 (+),score=207.86 TRINITY_DN1607_c0_g3_i1:74-2068(+)
MFGAFAVAAAVAEAWASTTVGPSHNVTGFLDASLNASFGDVESILPTDAEKSYNPLAAAALLLLPAALATQSGSVRVLTPCVVHWLVVFAPLILPVALLMVLPGTYAASAVLALATMAATYCYQTMRFGEKTRDTTPKEKRVRKVAVLGAGPVGLVAVKELVAEGHTVECFDAAADVGGVYAQCYDSARLTSSPFVTAFSDHAPTLDRHYHWTAPEYVQYLRTYAERFALRQYIQFSSRVVGVKRQDDGLWSVTVQRADGEQVTRTGFQHVAVCTGPNGHPNRPTFPGQDTFPGEVIHSSDYKNAKELAGKKVLVIGLGETAADVAAEIAEVSPGTLLSVRQQGAFVIPRINGLTGVNNDYDSNRLRYSVPKALHNLTAQLCAGLAKFAGRMSPGAAERYRLLVTSQKGAFSQFATKSDEFVPALVDGSLVMRPGVEKFEGSTVTFTDGTTAEIDAVVLCTGYGAKISTMFGYFDQSQLKFSCLTDLYKYVFPIEHGDELAFFGFARPHIGSIPMMAELQARTFAQVVSGAGVLPKPSEMQADVEEARRRWKEDFGEGRLKTMVNWIQYCDSLAALCSCRAPTGLWTQDPLLAAKLVTGPFTSFHYRFQGPGACPEEARRVVMALPHGMRIRDIFWFTAVHCISAVLRVGGLRKHISENSCHIY